MGFLLTGKEMELTFHCNNNCWHSILSGSHENGWIPEGTSLPCCKDWEGGYGTNDGQMVSGEDCKNLSNAAKRFLEKEEKQLLELLEIGHFKSYVIRIHERYIQILREFINFCDMSQDGFTIQ